uniref:Uncharacterized protein n=1 Tax=Tanacetum cinerariifolium TaxID=118510 RepID=A0A699GK68_TANCI|nr:hypothetical protein [Tanacetum cinerariifolium]
MVADAQVEQTPGLHHVTAHGRVHKAREQGHAPQLGVRKVGIAPRGNRSRHLEHLEREAHHVEQAHGFQFIPGFQLAPHHAGLDRQRGDQQHVVARQAEQAGARHQEHGAEIQELDQEARHAAQAAARRMIEQAGVVPFQRHGGSADAVTRIVRRFFVEHVLHVQAQLQVLETAVGIAEAHRGPARYGALRIVCLVQRDRGVAVRRGVGRLGRAVVAKRLGIRLGAVIPAQQRDRADIVDGGTHTMVANGPVAAQRGLPARHIDAAAQRPVRVAGAGTGQVVLFIAFRGGNRVVRRVGAAEFAVQRPPCAQALAVAQLKVNAAHFGHAAVDPWRAHHQQRAGAGNGIAVGIGDEVDRVGVAHDVARRGVLVLEGVVRRSQHDLAGLADAPDIDHQVHVAGRRNDQAIRAAGRFLRHQLWVGAAGAGRRLVAIDFGGAWQRRFLVDRAALRIPQVAKEELGAARRHLGQARRAEALGIAAPYGHGLGHGPFAAYLGHVVGLDARVFVGTAGKVEFQALEQRRAQLDKGRFDVALAIDDGVGQAVDVAGSQLRIGAQGDFLAPRFKPQGQAHGATGQAAEFGAGARIPLQDRGAVVAGGAAGQRGVGRQLGQRRAGGQLAQCGQVEAAEIRIFLARFVPQQARVPVPATPLPLQAGQRAVTGVGHLGAAGGVFKAVAHRGARIRERIVRVADFQDRLERIGNAGRGEVGDLALADGDGGGRVVAARAAIAQFDERLGIGAELERAAAQQVGVLAGALRFQKTHGIVVAEGAADEHAGPGQAHGRAAHQLLRRVATGVGHEARGGGGLGHGKVLRAGRALAVERGVAGHRAAVGRGQAAVQQPVLVDLDVGGVGACHAVALGDIGSKEHVVAILVEVALAPEQVDAALAEVVVVVGAGARAQPQSLEIGLGDEVDHAANGVRAVHGRGAVLEDFNTLDGGQRDAVQIVQRRVAVVRIGIRGRRHAATIEQDQRGRGRQAAQRGGRRAAGKAAVVDVQVVIAAHGGDCPHQLGNRGGAAGLDIGRIDHLDR